MKTAIVLILAILAQTAGNVCLTKGVKSLATDGGSIPEVVIAGVQTPLLLIGTGFLIIFFLLYSAALSWADLSFVLPATAFGYILHVAAGYYFLSESVSPLRWAGSVIITLGVVFVSRSDVKTFASVNGKKYVAAQSRGKFQ
jgi:drug/metabolite transporter (DMT)-like permease